MDYNLSESDNKNRVFLRYSIYSVIILILIIFIARSIIFKTIFKDKCASIKSRFALNVVAEKIGFSGIRTIYVENLTVKPDNRDTLFNLKKAEIKLDFSDLLFLKVNPLEIWLNEPKIRLIGDKDASNYAFLKGNSNANLLNENQLNRSEANQKINQAAIYRTLKAIFGLTTAKYHVHNFSFSYADSAYSALISVPDFESNDKGFNSLIEIRENGSLNCISLNGLTDKVNSSIIFKASMDKWKRPLPLLFHKFGVNFSFDTLDLIITARELIRDNIKLTLSSSVKSMNLFSEQISDQMVKVKQGSFYFDISITPDYYLIDSLSYIELNDLMANLYFKYSPTKDRYLSFNISTGKFLSQQLFDALPDGLFANLKGIKTSGTIDFGIDFGVKLNKPDSVHLVPKLITKDFSIEQYGARDFYAINDTFSYNVYRDGQFVKTIHLGYENKEFRTLGDISPLIVDAVITAEDGGFFSNSGFDIDAIKYAISQNISQNRFVRGGSTITMQLVKNLYLNKNKNLFRKAEEYLIVWLIESQGLVSKERLLEIYLNIIEWGPDVYGVTEACQFYFSKDPKDITLDEAIYLACIIPRPQKFKYLFQQDGNLKSFMEDEFTFVANKLFEREMITKEQLDGLRYNVSLKGSAKDQLRDTTSLISDSLNIDEIRLMRDTSLLLP
jgi:hypothetical protein